MREFFTDTDTEIYFLLFTKHGDLYDVVDLSGRSGMVDIAEVVRRTNGVK